MLLSEAIKVYIQAKKADGLTERTLTCYQRTLSYLLAFLGDRAVDSITANDLRAWLAELRERKAQASNSAREAVLSVFTIASYITMTKAFFHWLTADEVIAAWTTEAIQRRNNQVFHWLTADEVIAADPSRRIKKQKARRDQPKAIESADLKKMFDATDGTSVKARRERALILFLVDTGCRAGGVVGLKLADLHLDEGYTIVTEKGNKTRRVYLNPPTVAALRAWLTVRPATPLQNVFIGLRQSAPSALRPNGLGQILRSIARRAGVTGRYNPHSFRHHFAKRWLEQGGDMGRLADIMGHADIKTTWDSYAVWSSNELQEAHRRFSPITDLTEEEGKNE